MPCPLPSEIHDLIIDFLHDDDAALKACCVVSKSWVPRARRHLYARIVFDARPNSRLPNIHLWMEAFPDPSDSPARYTHSLVIHESLVAIAPYISWIRAFSDIVQLHLDGDVGPHFLIPLHGFSHTLKSLRLGCRTSIPFSEMFSFVCSFPLLENLWLAASINDAMGHEWSVPSTSPKFTGTLSLRMITGIRSVVRCLVELPGGLHFTNIDLACGDVELVTNLVSSCSETLESLKVHNFVLASDTPSIDLSGLTQLKYVMLGWDKQNVQWITTTLQSIKSRCLQQITINSYNDIEDIASGTVLREWQDLDRLLFQLWTLRSIRLKIVYEKGRGGHDLGSLAPTLLPELTSRGAVDLVEPDRHGILKIHPHIAALLGP